MKEKQTRVTFKDKSGEEPLVVNGTIKTALSQIKEATIEDANLQSDSNRDQSLSNHRTPRAITAKRSASAMLPSQINRPKAILRRTGSGKSAISDDVILDEELANDGIESSAPVIAQRLERTVSKSSPSASRQPSQIGQHPESYVNIAETRYSPAGNDLLSQTLRRLDSYVPDEVGASSKTPFQNEEPAEDDVETLSPFNRLSMCEISSGSQPSNFGRVSVTVRQKKQLKESWSSTTLSSNAPTDASDEADDHINVVLRVRPLNSQESSRNDKDITSFPGSGKIEIDNNGSMRQFGYNVVFEHEATQADLFEHSGVKKLIDMALNGYACTAVAFGQTGSGKTHTMTGPPQQFQDGKQPDPEMYGIIQRSLKYMFEQLKKQPGQKIIRASYLEIYNEQVIDLLNTNQRRYLAVRWSKNKGFYVENLFVVECATLDDIMAVLDEGMRNRQMGSHGLNEFSSRSHSMLMLTVDSEQQDPEDENLYITKRGKLTFVDLAGSEKVKDSNSTAESLVESNNINRSLLVLGNCISSLGDPKRRHGHIPYRDSKLTKLLADSLGGNGVTLMVCCITPSSHHASETMNTLRYASRAKKIQTKPVVKMDPREKLILSLKREIKVLKNENHYLRQQLDFPAKPKGQLARQNDENYIKLMQDKEKQNGTKDDMGLYEMLQEYMVENEALRSDNADLQNLRETHKRDQQVLYRDNEQLIKRVEDLERLLKQPSWQNMPRQQGPYPEHYQPYGGDHSPHQSAQNMRPVQGSGGRPVQSVPNNRLPPQQDLPLRDPVYPGSPPQGYVSPTGRSKPSPQQPRNGQQPMKPPHRLSEPIARQSPHELVNGHPSGHPSGHFHQGPPNPVKQDSANRIDSRRSSQSSSTDAIRDLNEKLKQELAHLDGEIYQHQALNSRQRQVYGSQGSIR